MPRVSAATDGRRAFVVRSVALFTFACGLLNLMSALTRFDPQRARPLTDLFPIEFLHIPRFLTVLAGFALVVSSVNILRRKRRAFVVVLGLAAASTIFHLARGLQYEAAAISALLGAVLLASRRAFTVESGNPESRSALLKLGAAIGIVLGYGIAGFWLLDRRDFGLTFHLPDAARMTLEYLTFQVDPHVQAHTRHARWFLHSFSLVTFAGLAYSAASLYAPAVYRLATLPRERTMAADIVSRHGRSALDYFKSWPDKSFFFSPSRETFIAYRVGANHAVALGDPVGPESEIEAAIAAFWRFCDERDWRVAFHQTLPDFLELYLRQGFKRLKIGEDAIVDLEHFKLEGRDRKELRHAVTRLDRDGIQTSWCDPPLPRAILDQARRVSDEWLGSGGHRERRFTLGMFEPAYIAQTPLFLSRDGTGHLLAFVNVIPSFCPGETTVDLMRRRTEAPNGVMDHLFVKLFMLCRERGYRRFNLGMAPMAGFDERDEASREERALHAFFQRLNFLFHYRGLRRYKAKFASTWEPRYLVYRNVLDLPSFAVAIGAITERKD